ncbi:MAG: universal stress protein [Flavobacteriaceae bacterium]
MNRILVPVDFSEHSGFALEVAAILARKYESEIIVLHMLGLSEAFLTKDETQEFAEAQYYMKLAKTRFERFLDQPYLEGLELRQIVQNYKIFSEVNQIATEQRVDLIVMGSHGTGGLSELFVGSNTEKVVRSSEIPVLVIKARRPEFKPEKVVFATDFSLEGLNAYNRISDLVTKWDAQICLVNVNLPNERYRSTQEKQEKANVFIEAAHGGKLPENTSIRFVSDYTVEGGLYFVAGDINANLIAIPTHGRSGLMHFFKGSLGEDLANHAQLPVVSCKM